MTTSVVKDFFREIRKNLGRFLSIFFIVALGSAFFAGLRSTGSDMKISADTFYDAQKLMDIQVIGTLGLTDDDLEDIRAIEGVQLAVGGFTKDALWQDGDQSMVMHTVARTDDINIAHVTEGRLPEAEDECLLDAGMLFGSDANIGDKITLTSGSVDDDLADSFNRTTFTIVGKGYLPYYIDLSRGSSSIGDGSVDAFLLLDPSAFNLDIYTEIYVSVEGSFDELTLSDEYKHKVEKVYDAIEDISDAACQRRYDSIYSEASEEIEDAKKEIDDGWKEVNDGWTELDDAKAELDDGRQQLLDAVSEVNANEAQLNDSQRELDEAKSALEENRRQYEAGVAELSAAIEQASAYPAIPPEMQAQFDATAAQLEGARLQLEAGQAQIDAAQAEIDDGRRQLLDARAEIRDNERELDDGQAEYDDKYEEATTELRDAEDELRDAEDELADAQAELDDLSVPQWYVLDRGMMVGPAGYDQNALRMNSIGDVFPVIFFLVAALVSLTAMTRMVDEQRMQIGTMKALGYSSSVIAGRYFWYAMLATVTGSVIGIFVGEKFLPYFIITSYGILYTGMPTVLIPINWTQGLLAIIASVASTGIATLAACAKQLKTHPAALMRPESPKNGHRVFLEHVPFIWKRLAFSVKSTIRNLLRYKKRFIMTVVGVGGCMALLLVGFGLKDSIQEIAQEEYINIFRFDARVSIDSDTEDSEQIDLLETIDSYDGVTGTEPILYKTLDLVHNKKTREAFLLVPENLDNLPDFLTLRDRITKEVYDPPKTGAAISEKTAKMLDLNIGDTVKLRDDDTEVSVAVSTIFENYIQHYIVISEDTYRELYGQEPEYNNIFVNYAPKTADEESDLATILMDKDACIGIQFVTDLGRDIDDMLGILNSVVWILIISAGLLAFIVLYNLNSINIMERRRELATLKVLGFYDTEISMYIFRENIILTVIGIALGLVLGTFLHSFTVVTVEVDLMMFGRSVSLFSYFISSLITLGFSLLVNFSMHFALKRIDMIESLKSVE